MSDVRGKQNGGRGAHEHGSRKWKGPRLSNCIVVDSVIPLFFHAVESRLIFDDATNAECLTNKGPLSRDSSDNGSFSTLCRLT